MQYRDADLVRRIGEVTALETRASGAQYAFAPCVAVSYICQNINHPTSMFHHAKYVHFYFCNAFLDFDMSSSSVSWWLCTLCWYGKYLCTVYDLILSLLFLKNMTCVIVYLFDGKFGWLLDPFAQNDHSV